MAHISEGAKVSIKNSTITRESSDSQGGDNSSFYGVGAAILATDGEAYVNNSTINTDAKGAAGLFAYGDGTVYAANDTITTTQDTSGGIHAAGGGALYAWDMTVETNGESSAAIRSDRGGGTMVVDGGTYTSNGIGSPAIYSTADISVNNATLTANGSEAICIEGLNSIHLFDSDLTGNMSDNEQNDCTWNVILYQSMSGDSEVGNSTFEMNGGSLTAKNGGMFYTTNTESTIILSDVDITYADDNDFFLKCTGNSNQRGWGESGNNGADCLFTATKQEMQGDVVWDSISQLDFYMTDGSTLAGAVTDDESNAGEGGDGYCNLYIGEDCTWTVLVTTISVSLLGLAAVFVLVVIFSRMVFRPVEESIQKQKRFITDASHELKTPLTIIDANTEVMEMESGESQWTKSTRKQIQRLSGLVQQLVTLSRLDEEKGPEEKCEFNLSEAVSECVQPYESLAQTREKNLTLNIEEDITYTGDERSIRQLAGILMDNAVKYSSENGNITLTLKKKGKKIFLEVYNDADDLPQGKLDVLFERFYRLDSSRNSGTGGSGIGLSVAKAIVQAHKGKITAENKNGRGLTITVIL